MTRYALSPNLMTLLMVVVILVFMVWRSDNVSQSCVQIAQSWNKAVLVAPMLLWNERLVSRRGVRQRFNPRRNAERRVRRYVSWKRRQPKVSRAVRRRCREQVVRALLQTSITNPTGQLKLGRPQSQSKGGVGKRGIGGVTEPQTDPLAELRQQRGWVDQMSESELWAILVRIRWPHGPVCPHCGEHDEEYVRLLKADYRNGLGRWHCQVCAEAGDPGEGGTFTPLTGTLLAGTKLDIRTLWLLVETFADSQASVKASKEAGVNRHTADRTFRLLRAAIYQARSTEPIVLGPQDVAECDEVYITAGLKGGAGGLTLEREARKRGLKRRGTWDSDRLPVFGLLCRGGEVRLFVLPNVQTATIRPIIEQMVEQGAKVYTDGYCIYHFLSQAGYQHQVVNHSAGEYARDLDGDGHYEVHCNTMECTWSWLRPMIRTYRGVSKVYLPLYVAQFEFFFNRRHHNHWNRTLDVLQTVFSVEGSQVADLLTKVEGTALAQICPVAG